MFMLADGNSRTRWALRDPASQRISLSTLCDSEDEVMRLLCAQRVHQPHASTTEPVQVVISIAAKPVGR